MKFKILVCDPKEEYLSFLENKLFSKKEEFDIIIIEDKISYLKEVYNYSKKVVEEEFDRLICIDSLGQEAFITSAKVKGSIVACIYDEHSSKMTRDHNGSKILCLGTDILAKEILTDIVLEFLEQEFSAGRHMVRVDMLKRMV